MEKAMVPKGKTIEVGILKELLRAIHSSLSRDEILNLILSHVRSLFDPDVCRICFFEPGKGARTFGQEREKTNVRRIPQLLPSPNGLPLCSRFQSSSAKLRLFEDLRSHPRLRETCLGRSQVRTCICIPVRSHNALLGCICVGSFTRNSGFLATTHPDLLEAIGSIAAIAMDSGNGHRSPLDPMIGNGRRLQRRSPDNPTIVGCSENLQSVLRTIRSVASSPATVLILGETGTGKELIAGAIHAWGDRARGKFVSQNCAALPDSLLESELFGHTKGAFTGALEEKMGLFEVADGGTLFLDEIAELSPRMQTILLRAIEEGEIRKLGGTVTRKVDVRVIAATSGDLDTLMGEKRFRKELFYRLSVVTVRMPPLRHRKGDIPLLARHFLSMYSRSNGKPFTSLDFRALAALEQYDWPGNIRELKNEIHRAVVLAEPGEILPLEALSERHWKPFPVQGWEPAVENVFDESLRAAEDQHIRRVLRASGGEISTAAARLKIHRNTLTRKVSEMGIRRRPSRYPSPWVQRKKDAEL